MQAVSRDHVLTTALDAAMEIEAALTGRNANRARISEFISAIDNYRAFDAATDPFRLSSDPTLFPAVTRAATAAAGHLSTVQQIQEWLRDLVMASRTATNNAENAEEALRRLQKFCLQLRAEIIADISSEQAQRVRRPAPYVHQVDPPLL